jgi:hypothetical protein
VLYDGKAIAFGPSQEVFARVRGLAPSQAAATNNKAARRAVSSQPV